MAGDAAWFVYDFVFAAKLADGSAAPPTAA